MNEVSASKFTRSMMADAPNLSATSMEYSIRAFAFSCIVLACATLVANRLVNVFIYPFAVSPLRTLPGPKDNLPFLGQCHKLLRATWVPHLFLDWSQTWPGSPFIRYLGLANAEFLVATSSSAYREILQTKASLFVKPLMTRQYAKPIIGDGLPFAHGQLHRSRRASLMRMFNTSHVKSLVPRIRAKAQQLVVVLRGVRPPSDEVEVQSHVWKTVLDVIGVDLVGSDLDHLGGSGSPLYDLFDSTMRPSAWGHIIHYLSHYMPWRKLMPAYQNINFIKSGRETRNILKSFLDVRRNSPLQAASRPGDVLQLMIDQGEEWEDDEIVEYLLNLFILGYDTTACTLVWALHLLAKHQKHQERLRTEIKKNLDPHGVLTFEDIERLAFLDNFLREVLRVYCPVAYVTRQATEDVVIDGVHIPKGTVVNLSPAVLNLHPSLWGDSAAEFDPHRWVAMAPTTASYSFESFHHGPRGCLGKTLSMTEMKIILVELVLAFRILPSTEAMAVQFATPSFTLRPKHLLSVLLLDVDDTQYSAEHEATVESVD